jgi:hypothetical protein
MSGVSIDDEKSVLKEMSLMAVIDAYRGWITADYFILRLTGVLSKNGDRSDNTIGHIDADTLGYILSEYSIRRNVAVEGDARCNLIKKLNSDCMQGILKEGFTKRAELLCKFSDENRIGERKINSAYSKLTWFLRPEDWTMFDKFVNSAVLRRNQSNMKECYENISKFWDENSSALSKKASDHKFNPLLGLRVFDKFLFCHGIGLYGPHHSKEGDAGQMYPERTRCEIFKSKNVSNLHRRLNLMIDAFPQCTARRLRDLAEEVCEDLGKIPM